MTIIPNLYHQLLSSEKLGGLEASEALLQKYLDEKGVDYDSFILSLQQ
jgi:hypothetical protein